MTLKCTKRIEFDSAHRVIGHGGKCQYVHGHRYALEATFESEELDNLGMVIDFAIIRELLGGWIMQNWDHATILFKEDKELGESIAKVTGQTVFYLPSNPTAENLAIYLKKEVCSNLFKDYKIKCASLKLYEGPNNYVEI